MTRPILEQAAAKLREMIHAPIVDLPQVSLMMGLMLSVEETMKHERSDLLQRGQDLEAAGQWMYSLQNTADMLKELGGKRTCMEFFAENFDEIDADFAKLSAWHHRVKELRERQMNKVAEYAHLDIEVGPFAEAAE